MNTRRNLAWMILVLGLLSGCIDPESLQVPEQKPKRLLSEIKGASLGAPEEIQTQEQGIVPPVQNRDQDLSDISRDIIVKNANTEDEMMVSPPSRRGATPVLPENFEKLSDEEQKNILHEGQRVSDFTNVSALQVPGYKTVYFSTLSSFVYFQDLGDANMPGADMTLFTQLHNQTDAAKGDAQIPEDIRKLAGAKIAIPGFMLPSELKDGQTGQFLLVQVVPSCFFCRIPNVSEWIDCKVVDGKSATYYMNKPVLILGTLEVGAKYIENDYLESIYRIRVDELRLLP